MMEIACVTVVWRNFSCADVAELKFGPTTDPNTTDPTTLAELKFGPTTDPITTDPRRRS